MTSQLSINPALTTNAAGTFNVTSSGLIQGTAYPDPSARFRLREGVLASTETLPMWGGVGISEFIPGVAGLNPILPLGPTVKRATALTGATLLTGFSVFDQSYSAINSPQSPVPLVGSYGQVMSYRLGSLARIAVACDPILADIVGLTIDSAVSWDFLNQELIPGVAAYPADTITGATYNSGTGVITITLTTGGELAVGDQFTISGVVSTGAGANVPNGYNGTFTAITGTTGTTLTYQGVAGGGANTPGTYSSGGTLNAGGGILPVQVLDVQTTNCLTVSYNSTTGFASWNYNGACAVVQI